jgi:hypothetical protein
MQLSAVWGCVWLLANCIASLPLFVYRDLGNGQRVLARDDQLYNLLHTAPNGRMTPAEFWCALLLNLFLARQRLRPHRARRLMAVLTRWCPWPPTRCEMEWLARWHRGVSLHARQRPSCLPGRRERACTSRKSATASSGSPRLEHMRATTSEAANAQTSANTLFCQRRQSRPAC